MFNIFEFLDTVVPIVIRGLNDIYNFMFTTLYENMVNLQMIDYPGALQGNINPIYPQWFQDLLGLRMIELILWGATVILIAHILRTVWDALPIV